MLPLTRIINNEEKICTIDIIVPLYNVLFMERSHLGTNIHFNMLNRSYVEEITVSQSLEKIQDLIKAVKE